MELLNNIVRKYRQICGVLVIVLVLFYLAFRFSLMKCFKFIKYSFWSNDYI